MRFFLVAIRYHKKNICKDFDCSSFEVTIIIHFAILHTTVNLYYFVSSLLLLLALSQTRRNLLNSKFKFKIRNKFNPFQFINKRAVWRPAKTLQVSKLLQLVLSLQIRLHANRWHLEVLELFSLALDLVL